MYFTRREPSRPGPCPFLTTWRASSQATSSLSAHRGPRACRCADQIAPPAREGGGNQETTDSRRQTIHGRAGLLVPGVVTVQPTLRVSIGNFHFESFRKRSERSKCEVYLRRMSIKIGKKEKSFGASKNKVSVIECEFAFLRSLGSSLWIRPLLENALTPSPLSVPAKLLSQLKGLPPQDHLGLHSFSLSFEFVR